MEKLYRFGRRLLAWSLFFLCWLFAIRWVEERWDRLFWGFWIMIAAAAGLFVLYVDRRILRAAEQAAYVQRQLDVLRLAEAEGGQLTASRVAARLEWPLHQAVTTLRSLEDGVRVTTFVPEPGVRLYEFPEIIHAPVPPDRVRVPGPRLASSSED
jgi:hypothetical protein